VEAYHLSILQAADFRSLSEPEILNKLGSLRTEIASVRFLQRTRGISEIKPGEQQNPDPEKVCAYLQADDIRMIKG
jgi:ribosomal protein L29